MSAPRDGFPPDSAVLKSISQGWPHITLQPQDVS